MEEQTLLRKVIDGLPMYMGWGLVLLRRRRELSSVAVAISVCYGIRRYLILQDHESPEYATEILTPGPLRFVKGFSWAMVRLWTPTFLAKLSDS